MNSENSLPQQISQVWTSAMSSILRFGASNGIETIVKASIGLGADINEVDQDENTPLVLAASAGHKGVVSILLQHNPETFDMAAAALAANDKGHKEITAMLVPLIAKKIGRSIFGEAVDFCASVLNSFRGSDTSPAPESPAEPTRVGKKHQFSARYLEIAAKYTKSPDAGSPTLSTK